MAKCEYLRVLGCRGPGEQCQPGQPLGQDLVQQSSDHGPPIIEYGISAGQGYWPNSRPGQVEVRGRRIETVDQAVAGEAARVVAAVAVGETVGQHAVDPLAVETGANTVQGRWGVRAVHACPMHPWAAQRCRCRHHAESQERGSPATSTRGRPTTSGRAGQPRDDEPVRSADLGHRRVEPV